MTSRRCGWLWALVRVALAIGLASGASLAATGRERDDVLAPPVEVSVEAGGGVQIELRVLFTGRPGLFGGNVGRDVVFVPVVPPQFGVIEEVRQLPLMGDRDMATAVYRHKPEAGGLIDAVRFEVRDAKDGTVLKNVPVTIRILRPVLNVEPRGRLWLGNCVTGDRVEGVVTIENIGGAPLSFQVAAWRPFYVQEAGRQIYLAPGARIPLRFQFQPEAPGFFETPLILKPDLVRGYSIEAKAIEAVTLSTNHLDFGTVRIGSDLRLPLRIQNSARTARDVEVRLSGPFAAEPASVRIPALAETEIGVVFRPAVPGEAAGWLVVRNGNLVGRCQLAGSARIGPDVSVTSDRFPDLGTVTGLVSRVDCRVLLTNRGDMAWEGKVTGDPSFNTDLLSVRVEPGRTQAVAVHYRPAAFGVHTGAIVFAGPTTASVTVVARSVVPSAAGPVTQPVAAPPATPLAPQSVTSTRESALAVSGSAPAADRPRFREAAKFDLDPLPVFEPANFRASVFGEGSVAVEWDPSVDLSLEHLDLYERRFQPLPGGGSGSVWSRRPEVPRLSADGKTASVILKELKEGRRFEFALADVADDDKPLRRTPIVEVEIAAPRRGWRVPWKWIMAAACVLFAVLHFHGPRVAPWAPKK
ncbi:MAG TPA: hypothetical protein PLU30_19260 [Verrucomicrobiae bacterium]|nr:hypothetical protein [Verrucomicrobiae bacterium]